MRKKSEVRTAVFWYNEYEQYQSEETVNHDIPVLHLSNVIIMIKVYALMLEGITFEKHLELMEKYYLYILW